MLLERPTSLQAILRNERRRMIAAEIQKSIQTEECPMESIMTIAKRLKVSGLEVLRVFDELVASSSEVPTHAQ